LINGESVFAALREAAAGQLTRLGFWPAATWSRVAPALQLLLLHGI